MCRNQLFSDHSEVEQPGVLAGLITLRSGGSNPPLATIYTVSKIKFLADLVSKHIIIGVIDNEFDVEEPFEIWNLS